MDGNRFDAFSKELAAGVSRRRLLRNLLLGSAGAAVFGAGTFGRALGQEEPPGTEVPVNPDTPQDSPASTDQNTTEQPPDTGGSAPPTGTDVPTSPDTPDPSNAGNPGDPPDPSLPSPTSENGDAQGDGNSDTGAPKSLDDPKPADACASCGECEICSGGACTNCEGLDPPLICCEGFGCVECCGDGDCFNFGGFCISGTCVKALCDACPDGMACCEPDGDTCMFCCADSDCGECQYCDGGVCKYVQCGDCETCSDGICKSDCQAGETCCFGDCVVADSCCDAVDCGDDLCCEDIGCAVCCSDADCPVDKKCCGHDGCWECCEDADCPDGSFCPRGSCVGPPSNPCEECPPYAWCFPDNPLGSCCPDGWVLCCGECLPWSEGLTEATCNGEACTCAVRNQSCANAECCEGLFCHPDQKVCLNPCHQIGGPCHVDQGCCGDLVCDTEHSVCIDGSGDPCDDCPAGSGCYPENPITVCCPPDYGLCCGLCMPWGPDIIRENCTGNACICRSEGMTCGYGIACCDDLSCDSASGRCVSGCAPVTHTCAHTDDCCDGLVCDNGYCATPCRVYTETCSVDDDCCDGLICHQGHCEPPCVTTWHPCEHDSDCCAGLICDPTHKICKESPTCHGLSETCRTDHDCCKDFSCIDGSCGTPHQCLEQGCACHPSLSCCGGLICNGYTCEIPPDKPSDGYHHGTSSGTTALPNTGSGGAGNDGSGLITLAALGAAAFAAGRFLRGNQAPTDTVEE